MNQATPADELRAWREAAGLTQDEVATAARAKGLPWVRDTVAALELGRRELTLDELVVLRGKPLERAEVASLFDRAKRQAPLSAASAAQLDAEGKAARKLGVEPPVVVAAAHRLWGMTLTEKRDRVLQDHVGVRALTVNYWQKQGVSVDEPVTSARTIQAARGHITRNLVAQLRDALRGSKGKRGARYVDGLKLPPPPVNASSRRRKAR